MKFENNKGIMETIYKKNLDFHKKVENTVNNDEPVKVSKDEVIKVLKILEGLKRTLLKVIKV